MFVVFEGIDGSGKTTLSDKVAEKLRALGVTTHHARPKGQLKSQLAGSIRTLARDPRNLNMSPHTELFLYIARDTQMIDTVIRPSLRAAEVVIADRYLHSPMVLCRARGMVEKEEIDQAISVAARGLWPDLVVYCDVDINTSYMRKRLDKIERPRDPDDFGRKGLRGLGLREAMRQEYRSLARDHGDSWLVVDNIELSIEENTAIIVDRILQDLGKHIDDRDDEEFSETTRMQVIPHESLQSERLRGEFYDYLRKLIENGGERAAAYHLRSLDSEEAWELRKRVVTKAPELVVYGISPLSSERAIEMRWNLLMQVPKTVARSLGAIWADTHDAAWEMRDQLASVVPTEVALTLGTLDSPRAWKMRELLYEEAKGAVLSSLKSLDSEEAWRLRDRCGGSRKWAWGLLEGLAQIDTERAWEIREQNRARALPWVILSTLGCSSELAWILRRDYFDQATKLVIKSLTGSDEAEAWKMRMTAGHWCKESLTTIKNVDSEAAWELRETLVERWPVFAAKSVGLTLAASRRGFDFLYDLAKKWPADPEVVHYTVKAYEAHHR
jgi:dTMP kinase